MYSYVDHHACESLEFLGELVVRILDDDAISYVFGEFREFISDTDSGRVSFPC